MGRWSSMPMLRALLATAVLLSPGPPAVARATPAPAAGAGEAAEPEAARVRGFVIEAFSGEPLAGASVSAGGISASTGADGGFLLRLPPGTWSLETAADGHLPDSQTVVLAAGRERRVDVYLLERSRLREEVVVEAQTGGGGEAPGTSPLRPTQVLQAAGAADNVFRTLQTLPGVAGVEEFGSRLAVRGGGPDQNLTVVDGVEVYNPYRLFGLTSAFNPETVKSFELQAGAFGAPYGDRLSSLLLIETRDGDASRRFSGSSSLGITDANLILEGALPGGGSGSWLLTGRRTYYDLVAERFTGSDLPSFADLQAKVTRETRPGQKLSLLALRSRESTDATVEGDRAGEQGDFVTAARNDLAALSFATSIGSRGSASTTLSFYRNVDGIDVDAQFRSDERRSNAPVDDSAFSLANVVFTRDLAVSDLALRQEGFYQAGSQHLLQGGFDLHRLSTGVSWRIPGDRNLSEANGSSVRGGAGLPSLLDSEQDSLRVGAWLQDRYHMMRRLVVEPGLRLDWSGLTGSAIVQPRLQASLRLSESTRLRAGAGLYAQGPGYEKLIQSDYFIDLSDARGTGLGFERSWQGVIGLERDLAGGVVARVEAYYKTFHDLVLGRLESVAERQARLAQYDFPAELESSIPSEAQITSRPVSGGGGRAYGFDVYVARGARSAETRLTGWASYTYGVAERDSYGRRMPFEYDRRHALSLVGSYRATRKLELSVTARVASGFPDTPILGLRVNAVADTLDGDGDGNTAELVPERDQSGLLVYTPDRGGVSNLLTARLPAFARVDLRASFRPKGPSGRWLFYLDVINVLNRENVGAYEARLEHDPGADRPRIVLDAGQSLPLLPSFGVRFDF
jgi:hypothetical protein